MSSAGRNAFGTLNAHPTAHPSSSKVTSGTRRLVLRSVGLGRSSSSVSMRLSSSWRTVEYDKVLPLAGDYEGT